MPVSPGRRHAAISYVGDDASADVSAGGVLLKGSGNSLCTFRTHLMVGCLLSAFYAYSMRKLPLVIAASAFGLLLSGCAGAQEDTLETPVATEHPPVTNDSSSDEISLSKITSCDDIKPFVETWTEGFEPYEWNNVSEDVIQCGWNTPPEEVTPDNARSVEVNLTRLGERPDYSPLAGMSGYEAISDDWVAANDGQAYTMTVDIGLSAVIATTVWVPGVEVTVSGGRWANLPELDGAAALGVAKQILG